MDEQNFTHISIDIKNFFDNLSTSTYFQKELNNLKTEINPLIKELTEYFRSNDNFDNNGTQPNTIVTKTKKLQKLYDSLVKINNAAITLEQEDSEEEEEEDKDEDYQDDEDY